MNWIALIAINVLADSTHIYIDNYVSDYYFKGKSSVSQKLFYGYANLLIAPLIALILGVNFNNMPIGSIFAFIATGVISGVAGIAYYRALEIENSTSLGIFLQFAPVLYLILGWFFLGESFSPLQLVAFAFILSAPILIVFSARKKSRHLEAKAAFFAFIYVILYVLSSFIFVKESDTISNINAALPLVIFGKGIGNLFIVYSRPKWRKRFYRVAAGNKYKMFKPMFLNSAISVTADLCYRLALATAPTVALASAISDTAEPIIIFFMGIVLTLISPKVGREKLNRKSVVTHLIATGLVVTGIIIMQI